MMPSTDLWLNVTEFLGREAVAIDDRDWDTWLDLYTAECEYWVPAWRRDGTLVQDPKTELSLVYYPNRLGLEARVYRLRTERAASAVDMPRTSHMSNLVAVEETEEGVRARTHWTVNCVYETRTVSYFGHAHYLLENTAGTWKIRSKKTVLLNDRIHEVLDFYNI